jgi:hypothetical protein
MYCPLRHSDVSSVQCDIYLRSLLLTNLEIVDVIAMKSSTAWIKMDNLGCLVYNRLEDDSVISLEILDQGLLMLPLLKSTL